jgi:hypothetical protein
MLLRLGFRLRPAARADPTTLVGGTGIGTGVLMRKSPLRRPVSIFLHNLKKNPGRASITQMGDMAEQQRGVVLAKQPHLHIN